MTYVAILVLKNQTQTSVKLLTETDHITSIAFTYCLIWEKIMCQKSTMHFFCKSNSSYKIFLHLQQCRKKSYTPKKLPETIAVGAKLYGFLITIFGTDDEVKRPVFC